jgi:hypothetical protein
MKSAVGWRQNRVCCDFNGASIRLMEQNFGQVLCVWPNSNGGVFSAFTPGRQPQHQ